LIHSCGASVFELDMFNWFHPVNGDPYIVLSRSPLFA
jgi:hypothetical protein